MSAANARILRAAPWAVVLVALALHLLAVNAVLVRAIRNERGNPPRPFHPTLAIFHDVTHRIGPGADFFALYHAGREVERGGNVYGIAADGATPYFYPFRYLPSLAQGPGRLLAQLPPWEAYYLWIALLEGLILCSLGLTWRLFRGSRLLPWLFALWLAYTPIWLELFMGQFSLLMGTLAFATGVALREKRVGASLSAWTVSVAVKIYTLVLLPLWLRIGKAWHAAALVALVVAINLPAFLSQPALWDTFVRANFGKEAVLILDTGNFGFAYFMHLLVFRLLGAPLSSWPAVYLVMQLAWLGTASVLALRFGRRKPINALVVLLLAHQLSYCQVWEHHYSLVPGLLLLVLANARSNTERAILLTAFVMLALPTPLYFWDSPGGDPMRHLNVLQRMALPGMKALPTLAVFAVATAQLLRRDVAAESADPREEPSLVAA